MAVACRILFLGIAATMLCPAAGVHGFLDSLIRGNSAHSAQAERKSERNVGRTVMDALRLALKFGSSGSPEDGSVPHAAKVFEKYDRAPDGKLSTGESNELLTELGFTADEIAQMQGEMDKNGDKFIDMREFNDYIQLPEEEAAPPAPKPPAPTRPPPVMPAPPAATQHPAPTQQEEIQPRPPVQEASPTGPPEAAPWTGQPEAMSTSIKPWAPTSETNKPPALPLPPMGRDETARALQGHAAKTQDTLVDAVENAEVAEIKRSVFRSLFRLRSAQIKEYDTIARLETQAIDDYNDKHQYRKENPVKYLSSLEGDVASDQYASFHNGMGDEDDI